MFRSTSPKTQWDVARDAFGDASHTSAQYTLSTSTGIRFASAYTGDNPEWTKDPYTDESSVFSFLEPTEDAIYVPMSSAIGEKALALSAHFQDMDVVRRVARVVEGPDPAITLASDSQLGWKPRKVLKVALAPMTQTIPERMDIDFWRKGKRDAEFATRVDRSRATSMHFNRSQFETLEATLQTDLIDIAQFVKDSIMHLPKPKVYPWRSPLNSWD